MDESRKIELKLDVENIGPHSENNSIHFSEKMDSLKAMFYASNGIGKSFISRTFRLLSPEKKGAFADELLTLGKTSGSLNLSIVNSDNPSDKKKLSVQVQSGSIPSMQNDTDYIFHVFNSEYVKENIEPNGYTPDGNIDGYIVSKIHIDLTKEKTQEKQLEKDIENKEKEIDKVIADAQKELHNNGIRTNINEYGLIDKERLRKPEDINCEKSFDEIVAQLKVLESLPDNLSDVPLLSFNIDISVLDEITSILNTSYPKSDWDEEFATKVKTKRDFVEKGLELSVDSGTCPFCEQEYSENALGLIQKYRAFLNDKEAQVLRQIDGLSKKTTSIVTAIKEFAIKIQLSNAEIEKLKKYFPSISGTELQQRNVSDISLTCFSIIDDAIRRKTVDISVTNFDIKTAIAECNRTIEDAKKRLAQNNDTINSINALKNNSSRERLSLRKNLCIAQYLRKRAQLEAAFKTVDEQNKNLKTLKESILLKEETARKSRKTEVFNTLDYFLNRFFSGKYTLDKNTFLIKFQNMTHEKASRVLSDGEKGIVAFCLYLASTHLLIEREDDYNRLFFIIDDPISSMDFHYVYAVAQSLRDIKECFGMSSHARIFVFTHNLEFYSIVARNYTITNTYVMRPGKIERLKEQLLMPYENHLHDIVKIANGEETPTHTIGNSIRHVLETVSKFEFPEKNLGKYISENKDLSENSCVFNLCQDLSHGAVRKQPPFDEQVLIGACKVVVKFMRAKYEGQINAI
jgi:hypothetical protein